VVESTERDASGAPWHARWAKDGLRGKREDDHDARGGQRGRDPPGGGKRGSG